MGREVESWHEFSHQSHRFGMEKETAIARCDDGAVYEFERGEGEPNFRLVRRFKPDGTVSTSRGVLPASVKETANDLLESWSK